jgi:GNAT superfamily N-acetyltransferase
MLNPELDRGGRNIAAFLAATAGRQGAVADVPGGVAIAGPIAFPNGFVNAAVKTDGEAPVDPFLDAAQAFFATHQRSFVLWALASDAALVAAAEERGAVADPITSVAMSVAAPVPAPKATQDLDVTVVTTDAQGEVFADLAERGYGIPGLGWLLTNHDTFRAPGTLWAIVGRGEQPLGVACSFGTDDVGGVYYVGTPEEHRGRGVAAVATAFVTNAQFDRGATSVVLQASAMGRGIYERLGFVPYDEYVSYVFPEA